MSNFPFNYFLIALVFFFSACTAVPPSPKVISISGDIDLPIPLGSNKYWMDDGPLFLANKSPLVAYRVIDKEELNLSDSDKTVYEFMVSSFSDPEGIFEKSFFNAHKEYDLKHKSKNGLEFYILNKKNEAKAYIVAKSVRSCVEVSVIGPDALLILDDIVSEVKFTKGE